MGVRSGNSGHTVKVEEIGSAYDLHVEVREGEV